VWNSPASLSPATKKPSAGAHLQAYREDRTVAQRLNGVFRRGVEQFGRVRLGKGERRSFPPINRRAFHVGDRIVFYMAVALEMLQQAGERREPAADGGGLSSSISRMMRSQAIYGAVVHLAQLAVGPDDAQRPHEMLHVALVSTAGAFAFLLGEPDFLLGCRRAGRWVPMRQENQLLFVFRCQLTV
jgi:hypothetical protein